MYSIVDNHVLYRGSPPPIFQVPTPGPIHSCYSIIGCTSYAVLYMSVAIGFACCARSHLFNMQNWAWHPSSLSVRIPIALRKKMHLYHKLQGLLGPCSWSPFAPCFLIHFVHTTCLSLTICLSLFLQNLYPFFLSQISYHLLRWLHHWAQVFSIHSARAISSLL